jgi:uncharacterized membrane protein
MDFEPFLRAPAHIQLHVIAAISALVVGAVQMFGPKGALPHRTLGILFVVLMAITAISAIFIRQIFNGWPSPIHIFVPLTFIGLWGIVQTARSGNRFGHGKEVRGLFFGALMIPGLVSFLPGRLMWEMVFG